MEQLLAVDEADRAASLVSFAGELNRFVTLYGLHMEAEEREVMDSLHAKLSREHLEAMSV